MAMGEAIGVAIQLFNQLKPATLLQVQKESRELLHERGLPVSWQTLSILAQ